MMSVMGICAGRVVRHNTKHSTRGVCAGLRLHLARIIAKRRGVYPYLRRRHDPQSSPLQALFQASPRSQPKTIVNVKFVSFQR